MRNLLAGLLLLVATAAVSQEGFPLDGTWRGEHTAADGSHQTIVLIMQWDGKRIAGTINPGPNAVEFSSAELMPAGWKVTLAAKTAGGKDISFEGAIADLGKYHRAIAGKWTEGGKSHDIRFVRE
jgi:hypothetical protein